MKPENLKLLLDKYIDSIDVIYNLVDLTEKNPKILTRKQVKDFTIECLQSMLNEISLYGTNTHSYVCLQSFLIEFKRLV